MRASSLRDKSLMSQGEEKTEAPTEQKLKEARKKGQVAKSADATGLSALFFAFMLLVFFVPFIVKKILMFLTNIHQQAYAGIDANAVLGVVREALDLWFFLSLPILLAAAVGAIAGNVGQFGLLLTSHPIKPDLKRVDPLAGLKKMFSKDRFVELFKQVSKFFIVFLVIFYSIKSFLAPISLLFRVEIATSMVLMSEYVIAIMVRVIICFLAIALLDILWQRHSFYKSMRMSKYEVKKEYIQQEGDPQIKQERKRFAQEVQESTSQAHINEAAVVITNPSHLAIAIKYGDEADEVPTLIAKGVGSAAKYLVSDATSLQIPVIRNVPLARDLQWLDINEEIPSHLYDSVAEVLLFVHDLNKKYGVKREDPASVASVAKFEP